MTDNRQSERATVMLTKTEKADMRLVAAFDLLSESDTLRLGIDAIAERAAKIRATAAA